MQSGDLGSLEGCGRVISMPFHGACLNCIVVSRKVDGTYRIEVGLIMLSTVEIMVPPVGRIGEAFRKKKLVTCESGTRIAVRN